MFVEIQYPKGGTCPFCGARSAHLSIKKADSYNDVREYDDASHSGALIMIANCMRCFHIFFVESSVALSKEAISSTLKMYISKFDYETYAPLFERIIVNPLQLQKGELDERCAESS